MAARKKIEPIEFARERRGGTIRWLVQSRNGHAIALSGRHYGRLTDAKRALRKLARILRDEGYC